MQRFILFLVLTFGPTWSCNTKSAVSQHRGFSGDIRLFTPFTKPSLQTGKLYISNGRLRVDLGPMTDVYILAQKKGWRIFAAGKQYSYIGEKQVSMYLPPMSNGSPCPNSHLPMSCKMLAKENIDGRQATKWETMNQHGERVSLWTDDGLQVALRLEIESVTYELRNIHEGLLPDSMFELPADYTHNPEFDFGK